MLVRGCAPGICGNIKSLLNSATRGQSSVKNFKMNLSQRTLLGQGVLLAGCLLLACSSVRAATTTGEAHSPAAEGEAHAGEVSVARGELETRRCAGYEEIEASTGITFVVVSLFGGLLCYHVLAWVPLPYTALLMVRSLQCLEVFYDVLRGRRCSACMRSIAWLMHADLVRGTCIWCTACIARSFVCASPSLRPRLKGFKLMIPPCEEVSGRCHWPCNHMHHACSAYAQEQRRW